MSIKYRCPKNPDHKNFLATAKVTQEWLCDDKGEYVSTVTPFIDVLHSPKELTLVCRECAAVAEEYESEQDIRDEGYRRLYGWIPHPSEIRGFMRYENESDFVVDGGHTPQSSDGRFSVSFSKITIQDRESDDGESAHNATVAMHLAWLTFEDGCRAYVWDKKEKLGWSYEHVGPEWEENFDTSDGDTPSDVRAVTKVSAHVSTETVEAYDDARDKPVPDVVDILREQDWSGWSICDQGMLVLMGKEGSGIAQIDEKTKEPGNRTFSAVVRGKNRRKSAIFKSLPEAIDWCESTRPE